MTKWMNRREACLVLGISLSSLNRLVKAGVLAKPYLLYIGRRVLISRDFVDALPSLMEGRQRSILQKATTNA
jgi:excisionase family DNA binding protein